MADDVKMGFPVIFLDIDGVLNVHRHERDKFGQLFHQKFVLNLARIISETTAKIVISSSWRFDGLKRMREMWEFRNLPGIIIDVTPNGYLMVNNGEIDKPDDGFTPDRGYEIKAWLDKHGEDVTSYVILDDDTDFLEEQLPFFVQTSENKDHPDCEDIGYGLTHQCAQKAIKILNGKS